MSSSAGSVAGLLSGKIAIITGASRGIGAAAARSFAAAGATVVLAARDASALGSVADAIVAAGGRARAVPTDVTDPAAVERLVEAAVAAYGRLDAAFNNAGEVHSATPLADLALDDFDRVMRVNTRGVLLALQFEIRAMLASGGGAIVNMSSTAGMNGVRGMAAYVAAKHAVVGLTKSAALDYAAQHIPGQRGSAWPDRERTHCTIGGRGARADRDQRALASDRHA